MIRDNEFGLEVHGLGRRKLLAGSRIAATDSTFPITPGFAATKPRHTSHQPKQERQVMDTITTKDGTKIFYKDWGTGQPIVFHHGRPLSSDDWDAQMLFFVSPGYRFVPHARRRQGR